MRFRRQASCDSLVPALLIGAAVALAACRSRGARSEAGSSVTSADAASPASAASNASALSSALPMPSEPPLSCATLRDVAVSDVVRVEGKTLFYADATAGLTLVDVSDAAHPRVLSVVPSVGIPRALFVREGVAWIVVLDADARAGSPGLGTVVRAVDVRVPESPRVIGEQRREGAARDATLVGGLLYLLYGSAKRTLVEAFGVEGTTLQALGSVAMDGEPAQLAASSAGLVVVTNGATHATAAWLDLSLERRGSIAVRRSVRWPGGVARWEHGDGRIVDADEGQRVRIVTCATKSCGPSEPATLRIINFAAAEPARSMSSLRLTEHAGLPATRFAGEVLYVADVPAPDHESTTLHVVRTDDGAPRFVAHLPLRGRIQALVPRDGSLVALGSTVAPAATADASTQVKIIVHDVDVRRVAAPRTRTSVTFGSDWTWSLVADDDHAMAFDPASHLVAVPFTAWRHADKRYATGAQLVDLRPIAGQLEASYGTDGWVERAIFLDGHLLTVGPNGIASMDLATMHQPELSEQPLAPQHGRE